MTYRQAHMGENTINALTELADRQESLEVELSELEAQIDAVKAKLKDISEIAIPEVLGNTDAKVTLPDGRIIAVRHRIRASIAGEKAGPACDWLDQHGHGDIVKREMTVRFDKDMADEEAMVYEAVMETAREHQMNPVVKRKMSVHPGTLEAWIRETLRDGEEVPEELFGIYNQYQTKISRKD